MRLLYRMMVATPLLISMVGLTSVPKVNPEPECVTAAKWVAENTDRLPTSLDEFSEYSLTYRKAIYRELSTPERETLWRAHIDQVLSNVALTVDQRLFLQRVKGLLGTHLETGPTPELEQLTAEAKAVLGMELGALALGTLGPAPEREVDALLSECSCSQGSDWCSISMGCSAADCDFQDWGCGTGWIYGCDGTCQMET